MNKITLAILIILGIIALIFGVKMIRNSPDQTNNSQVEPGINETQVVAENLDVPWEIVFLPGGSMLVTERTGQLVLIDPDGQKETIAQIEGVTAVSEGGLLGLSLHPDFDQNNFLYLYFTYQDSDGQLLNKVVRYRYQNRSLSESQIIVDQIPGARNHNGGRIKFGPDGFLYITTGDAQQSSLAQDTNSLAGKILRVTDEGQPAPDNPFNNLVYSYGHRNSQGLAWINNQLWATEHGASGEDELNQIEKGENYGWPNVTGSRQQSGTQSPVIQSGNETWAPAGLASLNGKLYFAGLRGQSLFVFNEENNQLSKRLENQFGRLRAVVVGPDGNLYISTSNTDSRGNPKEGDDKILKLAPNN
ncbi:MAG: PQQ-dependent sugar dehydrogenase [Patescibacteria group bacterium]|jgi:glucose/arabinose dehydrogenase